MLKTIIKQIEQDVTIQEAEAIAHYILSGTATELEIAVILTALKFKGYSYEMITGFTKAMKSLAMNIPVVENKYIDVCGTGGDGLNTFNISSTVSLLLASKINVVKHGNKSVTSNSGSADVLENLCIPIHKEAKLITESIRTRPYTFLYAPFVHPNMKYIMPVRRSLQFPTIFNIIGPLCNPIELNYQIVGVFCKELMLPIAKTLRELGLKRAAVIHGHNGMDELSVTGVNHAILLIDGQLITTTIDPKDYNIDYANLSDLIGGNPTENADITKDILSGKNSSKLDIVALNAGLAFYISEITTSVSEGVELAYILLKKQVGLQTLKKIKVVSWIY